MMTPFAFSTNFPTLPSNRGSPLVEMPSNYVENVANPRIGDGALVLAGAGDNAGAELQSHDLWIRLLIVEWRYA
jgi:hypothetical protein